MHSIEFPGRLYRIIHNNATPKSPCSTRFVRHSESLPLQLASAPFTPGETRKTGPELAARAVEIMQMREKTRGGPTFLFMPKMNNPSITLTCFQVVLREDIPGLPPPDLLRSVARLPGGLPEEPALSILPQHAAAFHQALHWERGI